MNRAILLAAVLYTVIGVGTAAIAGAAQTTSGREMWRVSAFAMSFVVFGLHIWHEQRRLRHRPRTAALHASLAIALAAFALALKAFAPALLPGSTRPRRYLWSLLIWPAMTMLPAFVVAWSAAAILARRKAPTDSSPTTDVFR